MTDTNADSEDETTDTLPVPRDDGETALAVYRGPADD